MWGWVGKVLGYWFSKCDLGPAASVSSKNFLEMQLFRFQPRLTQLETLGIENKNIYYNKTSGDSDAVKV